jgi:hypothetical protein
MGEKKLSTWIKKELRGGKHYPGGEFEQVDDVFHDLNAEFKTVYGEFSKKILNVRRELGRSLAEDYNVPLALGIVAYQVELDGILASEVACSLLKREYLRLKATDYAVPSFESAELDFAIKEGQWIEFLYKKFVRQINERAPTIATIEGMLASDDIPIEKILMIIYERNRITKGIITPIIRQWVSTHRETRAFQGALAIGEAIMKNPGRSEEVRVALTDKVEKVHKVFDRLKATLKIADFSQWSPRELEPITRNINDIEESLSKVDSSFETMSEPSLAELVFQIIPTGSASPAPLEKGGYVVLTSPIPRHGEIAPLLEDPYDFLERDIRLAKQREDTEQFMRNSVQKVHRVLADKNGSPAEVGVNMIMQMHDRFGLTKKPDRDELLTKLSSLMKKEQTEDLEVKEVIDLDAIYSFLSNYMIETFMHPSKSETK